MARPQQITIRLNHIENKAVREFAKRNQISISEYIRSLIFVKNNPECNGGTTTPPLESIINNQAHNAWSTERENDSTT